MRTIAAMSRAILITGASRGIGAAAARAFAERGDRVAVHYGASRERAEEVLAGLPGEGHAVVGADLADPDAVLAMVDASASALGSIDVLVNNAGVFEHHPITETTYAEWQRGLAADARRQPGGRRQRHLVRRAAHGRRRPHRQRRLARRVPRRAQGPGLRGEQGRASSPSASRSPARSGRFGIAVTSVAPGFTETDMAAEELVGEKGEARRAESPLGRVATPEEVAAAIVYLASPEAVMASGTVLDVNGASFLRM